MSPCGCGGGFGVKRLTCPGGRVHAGVVQATGERRADVLGRRFDTRPNALNLIRLVLAATVILWHAGIHGGHPLPPRPLTQLLGYVPVDGFFAISGFLIARSLRADRDLRAYATRRFLRIFPGYWGCLVVTAFVIAPLASLSAGTSLSLQGRVTYVLGNLSTVILAPGIDGGPGGVAHPGVWNLSFWTLAWEVGCYVVLGLLCVVGFLRARVVAATAIALWALALALFTSGFGVNWYLPYIGEVARLGLMFFCGVLTFLLRDRIPVSGRLAAAAAGVLIVSLTVLPDYRVGAAPALTYLLFWAALELGRHERLVLHHDFSYGTYIYGGSVQQAMFLAGAGATWLGSVVWTLACVAPLAVASWFLVERPALRRRPRPSQGDVFAPSRAAA